MGKPHSHPSLNCYDNHKCRCPKCRALNTQRSRRQRAGIKARTLPHSNGKILSEEELTRLRRMVGLIK